MSTFVEPNMYELSDFHGSMRVAFFPNSGPLHGSVRNNRVTYEDKTTSKEFLGAAVQVVPTNIGKLVTVTIRQSMDSGSTSFSFIVPRVNLLIDGSPRASIETEGITTTHRQSPVQALNRGQRDVYAVIPLVGTASITTLSYPPHEHPSSSPPPEPPRTPLPPSAFARRK